MYICAHIYSKPSLHSFVTVGRESITFLLIGNIAMWCFGILLPVRYQLASTQEAVFGVLAWILIHTVAMPLQLFFRFHSSVCLADVWHAAYRPFEQKLEYNRITDGDDDSDNEYDNKYNRTKSISTLDNESVINIVL